MNHEFWYLSRAAGFTAYMLLFVSVALGIGLGTRLFERVARRNLVFDLHRFTTILALAFTLFHVYVLLGDAYFSFNVWELSIPFLSPYRSWQIAAGVCSLYATIIVIVSFYVRQFIGYRAWRTMHFATFPMFAGALLHSVTSGTDTTEPWAKAIYLLTGLATLGLIAYRLQYHLPDGNLGRTLRLAGGAATVAVALPLIFASGLLTAANTGDSGSGGVTAATGPLASASSTTAPSSGNRHPVVDTFNGDFSGT